MLASVVQVRPGLGLRDQWRGGGIGTAVQRRKGRPQRASDRPRVTQPASDNLKCGAQGWGQRRIPGVGRPQAGALSPTPNRHRC